MKKILPLLLLHLSSVALMGQAAAVFMLGDDDQRYEQLSDSHPATLLDAAGGRLDTAAVHWLSLLRAMEAQAQAVRYELGGIRMWLHVFFAADGQITSIGFRLRPESRNVDTAGLRDFLTGFVRVSPAGLPYRSPYAHYTSATFPTYVER